MPLPLKITSLGSRGVDKASDMPSDIPTAAGVWMCRLKGES